MSVITSKSCVICGSQVAKHLDADGAHFFCRVCFHLEKDARTSVDYSGYALPALEDQSLREQVQFIARGLPDCAKVFELGVSQGRLAHVIRESRNITRYDGIELSERASYPPELIDVLFRLPLERIPIEDRLRYAPYDLVIMSHVLEHIRDVDSVLNLIRDLTGDEGRLFIEVPNRAGHPAIDVDLNWLHYHSFSATSLTMLLQRHGYEVLHTESGAFHNARYSDSLRILAALGRSPERVHRPFISDALERRSIERVAVWGAGLQTIELLLPYIDPRRIEFFVDSSLEKQGKTIAGKRVVAPDFLITSPGTIVFINSIDYEDDIRQRIERDFSRYVKQIVTMSDVLRDEHQRAFASVRLSQPN